MNKAVVQKYTNLFNTVRYLKLQQIFYRIFYYLRSIVSNEKLATNLNIDTVNINFSDFIIKQTSLIDNTFNFLNQPKSYKLGFINWNENEYGLLWAYNLNYFDYILQESISIETSLEIINDFINNYKKNKVGSQPYPISLRGINWIKFLSKHKIKDEKIIKHLFGQYLQLSNNLEFHLLGNHLLENAFSLLFAAYYFNHKPFYKKAQKILYKELNEQILNDGAHFELSPMYHQIILDRLLDSLNLVKNNSVFSDKTFLEFLILKSQLMLSWLEQMTFKNGDIPYFNDAAPKIAPTFKELSEYAIDLNLNYKKIPLRQSGYRKIAKNDYELIFDVGNIGPDYLPGHAHSDTFNFQLNIFDKPLIVDSGTSTYEAGSIRQYERSTRAHNTVQYQNFEQSAIWSSFRVGQRAKIIQLVEEPDSICAQHNGYKKYGIIHQRKVVFTDSSITLFDKLIAKQSEPGIAFIHFHNLAKPIIKDNQINTEKCVIRFSNADKIELSDYSLAIGFNKTIPAKVAQIKFTSNLETSIQLR